MTVLRRQPKLLTPTARGPVRRGAAPHPAGYYGECQTGVPWFLHDARSQPTNERTARSLKLAALLEWLQTHPPTIR